MPNKSKWTVIFDDKKILNQSVTNSDGWATAYEIDDDAFWNDPKWQDINAIQYMRKNKIECDYIFKIHTKLTNNAGEGLPNWRKHLIIVSL